MRTRLVLEMDGKNPPVEASEWEDHIGHVQRLIGEGYTSGELQGEGCSGWWWLQEDTTRHTVDPGRWIKRDGIPLFAIMLDPERKGWNHFGPTDADRMAHKVAAFLNADKASSE